MRPDGIPRGRKKWVGWPKQPSVKGASCAISSRARISQRPLFNFQARPADRCLGGDAVRPDTIPLNCNHLVAPICVTLRAYCGHPPQISSLL